MSGMARMTVSAPRKLLREFGWLCHRRGKSASGVLRAYMAEFVDSRWAELEACDDAPRKLEVFAREVIESGEVLLPLGAVASRTRGSEP